MQSIFSLKGKQILITGASSGIGRAVAQQCAIAGGRCLITGRDQHRLTAVLDSLAGAGHSAVCADLTDMEQLSALVATIPKLDGVVCCAGIADTTIFKFTDNESLARIFETNTFSVIRLIRELTNNKTLAKESSIVMITSISGVRCGYIGGSLYGASKGALEGFMKGTALELAPRKIRINTIVPGMIETPLLEQSSISEDQLREDMNKYPMKRYGHPEEVGYAVVYMLSDATKWMTGTSLVIDGGYTLN